MKHILLDGSWTLIGNDFTIPATVPGCQYTDLLSAGKIPDPFAACNESKVQWVAERDWTYRKTFSVDHTLTAYEHIDLYFDAVDTLAEILLNGKSILQCDNAHIGYRIDVKPFLAEGDNLLEVKFRSPFPYLEELQREDPMPRNMMGTTGIPHLRKPQCHFGWDWGPTLPIAGLTRSVGLRAYNGSALGGIKIRQSHEDGRVTLTVAPRNAKVDFVVSVQSPDGSVTEAAANAGESATIVIDHPSLWWTAELSGQREQPLYRVTVATTQEGGDVIVRKIGLRTVTLDRAPDRYGKQFRFLLNGIPLFIKGANWIPADSFVTRVDGARLEAMIGDALDANFNMLRVWGGGYYESEAFYDLCDRKGLLVWQDFAFACAPYPFYRESFLQNVLREVDYNVDRLETHPSLAVWCGNNEIEAMSAGWLNRKKLIDWTEKFFYHILPDRLAELESAVPYTEGSPVSGTFMKDVGADHSGDTHLWQVWHGQRPLSYYRERYTRFCSEFGLESLPDLNTIRYFAEEDELDLRSPAMLAHQKCMSGNGKMLYYVSTRFRIPRRFEDLVGLTQIVQAECVRYATEHWRRNRGRCNGSMYWQFNDCWPVASWSGIDCFGRKKALHFAAKRFFSPVAVSIAESGQKAEVFAVNDLAAPFEGSASIRLMTFDGKTLVSDNLQVSVPALTAVSLGWFDYESQLKQYRNNCVLCVDLYDKQQCSVSRSTCLFAAEKDLDLPVAPITLATEMQGDAVEVHLTSDCYQRYVRLDADAQDAVFSDNCFDLMPGEIKTVTVRSGSKAINVSARSLAIAPAKGSKWSDAWFRLRFSLIPINLANRIIYRFM